MGLWVMGDGKAGKRFQGRGGPLGGGGPDWRKLSQP